MKIGFAVITEKSFLEKIVCIENNHHDEFGFHDRLGTEHNLPHITIFQGDMDESMDYGQIAEQIADEIRIAMPRREIGFSNVVYVPEGWYFWECLKAPELSAVHNYTLSIVGKYIVLDPKRMDCDWENLSDIRKKGIERYGYRFAGEAFYPHITIGRTGGRREGILETLNTELHPQQTYIERVTVYRMGDNGTHESILYEVGL